MKFRRISLITLWFLVAILSLGVVLSGPARSIAGKSSSQCDAYARDYADNHSTFGKGIVGGAVGGAGRIVGGVTGSKESVTNDWHSVYNRAYDRCMKGK